MTLNSSFISWSSFTCSPLQAQKEYPEFAEQAISDVQLFDEISKFVEDKNMDPVLKKIRARMAEEEERKEKKASVVSLFMPTFIYFLAMSHCSTWANSIRS